jgi:AcrR family transcriptional regulator
MTGPRTRQAHATETRELILTTAERLFAEHGVAAVSNRQISEVAGQANNFAVGYHFGTKTDLVLAIVRRHTPAIEQRRAGMLSALQDPSELRDWLACLVLPSTSHLAALGNPSWYARFIAQATTDPALRQLVIDETVASTSMLVVTEGLKRLMPVLPADVAAERGDMSRHLIVHVCAERERALHEGSATPRATWEGAAIGLIDALVGLWQAPYTPTG